jgi:hypothetical protein
MNNLTNLFFAFITAFFLTGIALWYYLRNQCNTHRYWHIVLFSAISVGAITAGIMTIVALAIDDWNACRLVPATALFYGYPLYATANDPANAFAYGPIGAWVYLPAAAIAIFLGSPTLGILSGIVTSFIIMCFPVFILITKSSSSIIYKLASGILAVGLFVALSPLRYVTFSIHVDAVGLASAALAVFFAAQTNRENAKSSYVCGVLCGVAVLSKQIFIPVGGVCFILLFLIGSAALVRAGIAFILVALFTFMVVWVSGSSSGFIDMYINFFSGSASRMTFLKSFVEMLPSLTIQVFILLLVWIAAGVKIPSISNLHQALIINSDARTIFGFLFAAAGFTPVGCSAARILGGDVNHYAIAIYFLTLLTVFLLVRISNKNSERALQPSWLVCAALLVSAASTWPYLLRFPGWYLYDNNFLEQAMKYSQKNAGAVYFPWQPLSVLLGEGRLYHLGEQLHYEILAGKPRHSREQYLRHIPGEDRPVAVRPYGAPASVIPLVFPEHKLSEAEPGLAGWSIFRCSSCNSTEKENTHN